MFLQKKKLENLSPYPPKEKLFAFLQYNLCSTKAVLILMMGPPEAEAASTVSVKAYGQSLPTSPATDCSNSLPEIW